MYNNSTLNNAKTISIYLYDDCTVSLLMYTTIIYVYVLNINRPDDNADLY